MNATSKIMATIADERCTPEFIAALTAAGMEAVRINSAHVNPDSIRLMIATIRDVDPAVRILMDTKGPEIRTTALADGVDTVELTPGASVVVVADPQVATSAERISIAISQIRGHLREGDRLLIDDGAIELEITHADTDEVTARVVRGGQLGSRKTVAVPRVELPMLPAVSDRDRVNIAAALECGIDMIAHSFVRSAADVRAVRELLPADGSVELYAKIECRDAIDNLDEIIAAADGLLVARGDLGTQVAPERIPAIQTAVTRIAKAAGKPVIVATQMLDSMMDRPYPSRAELTDIAYATMLRTDYLLLTGETARGKFPVECVDVMRRVILNTARFDATGEF